MKSLNQISENTFIDYFNYRGRIVSITRSIYRYGEQLFIYQIQFIDTKVNETAFDLNCTVSDGSIVDIEKVMNDFYKEHMLNRFGHYEEPCAFPEDELLKLINKVEEELKS